ncbi:MAG: large subunit ribosomal protein [Solirubrobacteraceae bacterium]|jgi:ribosomal protein L22|nr:large subunit ribosomal protein [Solirubrobacteraceae bacterium]
MAEDHPTPAEPEPTTPAAEQADPEPVTPAETAAPPAPTQAAAESEPEPAPKAAKAKAKPRAKKAAPAKAPAEPKAKAKAPIPGRSRRRSELPEGVAPPVVRAQAKYVRTSARKARLVCDHIRGKSVVEARAILAFAPRAVAEDWAKLLNSAVANAEHNHELIGEDLRVKEAFADEGPTLKRFRPRAMGRATPIRKRTSHLTITLTPKED